MRWKPPSNTTEAEDWDLATKGVRIFRLVLGDRLGGGGGGTG